MIIDRSILSDVYDTLKSNHDDLVGHVLNSYDFLHCSQQEYSMLVSLLDTIIYPMRKLLDELQEFNSSEPISET